MRPQTIITMGSAVVDDMLFQFGARYRRRIAVTVNGEHRTDSRLEFLHRSTIYTRRPDRDARRIVMDGLRPLFVVYGPGAAGQADVERYLSMLSASGAESCGVLQLMRIQGGISASGWLKDHGRFLPIDVLSLVGAGMHKLSVAGMWPLKGNEDFEATSENHNASVPENDDWLDYFSRVEAFAGEGDRDKGRGIILKIAESDIAVVGDGRMGWSVAEHLVNMGAGKIGRIYLIDPQLVEKANLDAVPWPRRAVGMPKAVAAACMLLGADRELNVYPIVEDVSGPNAVRAVIGSQYVFCCLDNVPGRVRTAILAQLYDRMLFDFTGGAAYTQSNDTAVAGEVRVSQPGSPGCPVCMSGDGWRESLRQLSEDEENPGPEEHDEDWLRQRPGSCKAVTSSVVGTGVLLFLRLLQGRLRRSIWLHYDGNGIRPEWPDWTSRADSRTCQVCSESGVRGLGDWSVKRWMKKTD